MTILVDTHVRVDALTDATSVVGEAAAVGVDRLIAVGGDEKQNKRAIEIANGHREVWAAIGCDPLVATGISYYELLRFAVGNPRVVAIGETGLDYARAPFAGWNQMNHFRICAELARDLELPVILHCRAAAGDLMPVVREFHLQGVVHFFDSDWDDARRFLDSGLYLSFSGNVTRPNREALRVVVRKCPKDKLLLESSAPRGKDFGAPQGPNRPARLAAIARAVAMILEVSIDEVAATETANALALFSRMK